MRKVLWLWTATFVIILLWLYFLFISPKIFNNKILVVPEIINLNEEEGLKVLKDNNIKYNIVYLENEENIKNFTILLNKLIYSNPAYVFFDQDKKETLEITYQDAINDITLKQYISTFVDSDVLCFQTKVINKSSKNILSIIFKTFLTFFFFLTFTIVSFDLVFFFFSIFFILNFPSFLLLK